jgi:hypothetical protein
LSLVWSRLISYGVDVLEEDIVPLRMPGQEKAIGNEAGMPIAQFPFGVSRKFIDWLVDRGFATEESQEEGLPSQGGQHSLGAFQRQAGVRKALGEDLWLPDIAVRASEVARRVYGVVGEE